MGQQSYLRELTFPAGNTPSRDSWLLHRDCAIVVAMERRFRHRPSIFVLRRLRALIAQFRYSGTDRGEIVCTTRACHSSSPFTALCQLARPLSVRAESRYLEDKHRTRD